MSNLRQIGYALRLYRDDFGSVEFGPSDLMGLPPSPTRLKPYLRDERVLKCPYAPLLDLSGRRVRLDYYSYNLWTNDIPEGEGMPRNLPTWEYVISQRGSDYPIFFDQWHDPPRVYPRPTRFLLVLRLNGRAGGRNVGLLDEGWRY